MQLDMSNEVLRISEFSWNIFRTLNKTTVQFAASYVPLLYTVLSNTKQSEQLQTVYSCRVLPPRVSVSTQRRQPGRTDPGQQSDQDEHQHVRTTDANRPGRCTVWTAATDGRSTPIHTK